MVRISIDDRRLVLGLELRPHIALDDLPTSVENRFETSAGAAVARIPGIQAIDLLVRHPGERLRPPPTKPALVRPASDRRPPQRSVYQDPMRYPFGQSLRGRTIAISPGHGYIYFDSLGRFSTQRGNTKWDGCGSCRGIVEDFETHEIAVSYLIPLLEGAGAKVVLVRDRDYNGAGTLQDDGDPGYTETMGSFQAGNSAGGNGGDYRVSFDPDAQLEWSLQAATDGPQTLSMWFVAGGNRYADARLEVLGPHGVAEYFIDMKSHGRRWAPIGLFDLAQGDEMTVRLMAPIMPGSNEVLIADAVRLGAGQHTSGNPWWSMGAKPFAEYQGAPADILTSGDVSLRPRYAEWYDADIYIALHSNASGIENFSGGGSVTYRYSCGTFANHANDPDPSQCDDPAGSDRLQELVHAKMVEKITADFDPSWRDRGTKVANFGEVRSLDDMPGILIESGFHDNVTLDSGAPQRMTDNQALHDPRWRRATAFGIYEGISEYFNGTGPLLAPPPQALALKRSSPTSVTLDFIPPSGAMGYRVYTAVGGRTFDQGQIFESPPITLENLPAEAPISVRVASLNEAGEGRRSAAVAARPSARPAQILLLDGFEREDAWVQEFDNRGDTLITHGLAAATSEAAFDSVNQAGWEARLITLSDYDAVIVSLGRESTEHGILTRELRDQLLSFAASGGVVLASGSEIGWALDPRGDEEGRTFLRTLFGAAYQADDAQSLQLTTAMGGWFQDLDPGVLATDDQGRLNAFFSDVFTTLNSGEPELIYGSGEIAAVRSDANVVFGFALDSVLSDQARADLVRTWIERAVMVAPPQMGADAGVMPTVDMGAPPKTDAGDTTGTPDLGVLSDLGTPEVDLGDGVDRKPGEYPVGNTCGCTSAHPRKGPSAWFLVILLGLLARRGSWYPSER